MSTIKIPAVTIASFEDFSLDVEAFDHVAHAYLAWLYLEQSDLEEATEQYISGLKALTTRLGIPGKYHDTITRFFMLLIDERKRLGDFGTWSGFATKNPDVLAGKDNVIFRYYRPETLKSEAARKQFILPDRGLLLDAA